MGTCPAWYEKGFPDFCVCISSLLICLCQILIITLAYNSGCFPSKHTSQFTLFCTHFVKHLGDVSV